MRNLKRLLLNNLLLLTAAAVGWSGEMSSQNQDWVITKDLFGASGSPMMTSADYSLAFAWGEPLSGHVAQEPTYNVISGYFGGRFGIAQSMKVLSTLVGTAQSKSFYQDQVQVGVPYDAPVLITLSDQVDDATIASGVQVVLAMDHLGQASNVHSSFTYTSDPTHHTLEIRPQGTWLANTLYDIQITPRLLSIDSFALDQSYHIYFVTILDHHQENVVLVPIAPAASAANVSPASIGVMAIEIPTGSLSDYSTVLLSRDPLIAPLRADPKIIQEANEKARAAGGLYRVPVAIQEISAYNAQGDVMGPLAKPALLTIGYGGAGGTSAAPGVIRPQTLSLWVLDETHRLWVKIPASQNALGLQTVTAPVAAFSVFALMGSPAGSAADSYAYPIPWRPHGPNAGINPGQTGTETDGINFSNIPSECTITIYTIAGERVRELHHSDMAGSIARERWDVKTTHGEPVASGVYLWRVESSVDGKNGKLMVIR